jgi:hypothetical protein
MINVTTDNNKSLKNSQSYRSVKSVNDKIINSDKTNEILRNYFNNEYFLENQAIRNSFGKMVSTRNQTNPKYSFCKEERFSNLLNKETLAYIRYLEEQKLIDFNTINKNPKKNNLSKSLEIKSLSPYRQKINKFKKSNKSNVQTDFLYCPATPVLYKYARPPKWGFAKTPRGDVMKSNKYDYYDQPFDKKYDEKNINKQWDSRIIGGDIGVEERFSANKNYCKEAVKPGPGGYNPNYNYYKYKQYNYGYMGIKTEDNNNKNKMKDDDGKYYNINCQIGSDINNYKFSNGPRFIFGTSKRELAKKNGFKINESYLKYSAFGEQIMAQKDSRPNFSFGKQDRFTKI